MTLLPCLYNSNNQIRKIEKECNVDLNWLCELTHDFIFSGGNILPEIIIENKIIVLSWKLDEEFCYINSKLYDTNNIEVKIVDTNNDVTLNVLYFDIRKFSKEIRNYIYELKLFYDVENIKSLEDGWFGFWTESESYNIDDVEFVKQIAIRIQRKMNCFLHTYPSTEGNIYFEYDVEYYKNEIEFDLNNKIIVFKNCDIVNNNCVEYRYSFNEIDEIYDNLKTLLQGAYCSE